MKTKPRLLVTLLAILLLAANPGPGLPAEQPLSAEQWREDFEHMAVEMERQHNDLFHVMTRDSWVRSIEQVHQQIPSLEPHEVVVELARVANAVGDGHSGIRLFADPQIAFRSYPLKLVWLADGLFVEAIEGQYGSAAGARVTQIGKMPVREAIATVAPLIARDNDQDLKTFAPTLLVMP
jgi:hypothetical protein